ncbi:unnamed protein product [Mytilus coruscus]|uniref:Uncharacterized protein n=1 Tax=Mytilus coruscus TaxID=42192 RepID=A0A6J8B8Q2_MYTCO|nr:unnamed protein product [Mytilus coruscus]
MILTSAGVGCNVQIIQLAPLNSDDAELLLSEISLLNTYKTEEYTICDQHLKYVKEENRLTWVRRKCCIPSSISAHKGLAKGDRKITKDVMCKILSTTCLVVPIGAPICTNCRKDLSVQQKIKPVETICHESYAEGATSCIAITEEKRERHTIVEVNCFSDADSESQPIFSQDSEASVCGIGKLEKLNAYLEITNVSPIKEKTTPLSTSCEKTRKKCVSKALECLTAICSTICPCEGEELETMVLQATQTLLNERYLTLYKILNDCSASVRKCIEGLDYYVAEGGRSFLDLENIIEKLEITDERKKEMISCLLSGKRYLKSDFKVHIEAESNIADHCRLFALSEGEVQCGHSHTEICLQCRNLDEILNEISTIVQNVNWENKDAVLFQVLYMLSQLLIALQTGKPIMRSRNQEDAMLDLVRELKDGQVLVICDWAMKMLPRKYKEGQIDWFAKRGMNWHISVSVFKEQGCIKNFTHVHIFSAQISQDSPIISSLIKDTVADLHTLIPDIQEIHIYSDNAGCYKNTLMMASLRRDVGNKLKSYNFSEVQDGKVYHETARMTTVGTLIPRGQSVFPHHHEKTQNSGEAADNNFPNDKFL